MGQRSVSGYCAVLPRPSSLLSTGSRSAQHVCSLVLLPNITEDPKFLIRFFIILVTSATDLALNTKIERVGGYDFDFQFHIQGAEYNVSMLLYDIGADAQCGRGTWVFEVEDKETKEYLS